MYGLLARWREDRRGSTAVEFAMLAPMFFLLVAAVVEAAFLHAGNMSLEAGARAAARYGLTGAADTAATRTETVRRIVTEHVCPSAVDGDADGRCFWAPDGPLSEDENGDPSPLELVVRAYTDPANVGLSEPCTDADPADGVCDPGGEFVDVNGNGVWDADTGLAGPGGPSDVVVYEARIHQKVANPLIRAAIADSFLSHEARIVIRNEPY